MSLGRRFSVVSGSHSGLCSYRRPQRRAQAGLHYQPSVFGVHGMITAGIRCFHPPH